MTPDTARSSVALADAEVERLRVRIGTVGKCVGTATPDKWRPRRGFTTGEYRAYGEWACRGCRVQASCALLAVLTGQGGSGSTTVWGGLCGADLGTLAADRKDIECLSVLAEHEPQDTPDQGEQPREQRRDGAA